MNTQYANAIWGNRLMSGTLIGITVSYYAPAQIKPIITDGKLAGGTGQSSNDSEWYNDDYMQTMTALTAEELLNTQTFTDRNNCKKFCARENSKNTELTSAISNTMKYINETLLQK